MTNEAQRWREQGLAAMQAGDRARAESMFLESARLAPNDPEVWLLLGWAAATPAQALEYISRAVSLTPQDPRVQKAHAWAQGRVQEAGGRPVPPPAPAGPPPLETLSPTPVEDTSPSPEDAFQQGVALLDRGEPAGAVSFLEAAVQEEPTRSDYHAQLAVAYYHTGRVDEAIERLQRAVELQPRFDEGYYTLGVIYAERGQTEQAIAAWRQCLRVNPRHADAHRDLDALLQRDQERPGPETAYQQGVALLEQGEPAQAVPFLEAAVQEDPVHADYRAQLAVAYYHIGQTDGAIEQFQRAIDLRPEFIEALYSLGVVYKEQGREEEAIASLQRCLNLEPRHADARRDLGILLKQREERLFKEARGYRDPPPAGVPERSGVPEEPPETRLVKVPVDRTRLPTVIAVMWGLWTLAYGMVLLGVLGSMVMLPEFVRQMQLQGVAVSPAEEQVLWVFLFVFLCIFGFFTLVGGLFTMGNIRRWPWVFYGNIAVGVLFILMTLCNVALMSNLGTQISGAAGAGSVSIEGAFIAVVCNFLPPIAVIALSVFARGDFKRETIAVVIEGEELPTGKAIDYYNRGLRRSKRGRLDRAIADWEAAVRMEPGDPMFRNVLALGYAEQERFAQAIEQLEAALQIAPNDPTTLDNLQVVRDMQARR